MLNHVLVEINQYKNQVHTYSLVTAVLHYIPAIEYAAVHNVTVPSIYEPTYTDIDTVLLHLPSIYNKCSFDPHIPPTLPVSLDELGSYVANCHIDGFSTQYQVHMELISTRLM